MICSSWSSREPDLAAHALEALAAGLQIGHADGVFVGHPQGEVAGRFAQQPPVRLAIERSDRGQPIEILGSVRDVLVVRQPPDPGEKRGSGSGRELPLDAIGEGGECGTHCSSGRRRRPRPAAASPCVAMRYPAANAARLDSTPTPPRRIASSKAWLREGQASGAGERAEHHRADHAAGVLGRAREVAGHEPLGRGPARVEERLCIDAAVAHRGPLGHRIDAMGRGDEGGALGRHQPALDRAARFHQLRGDHDVHLARERHQRQHRLLAADLGKDLHVVDRRARALRDARHGGGLDVVAGMLGHVHDPVGQHPAALSAHGEDGYVERLPCPLVALTSTPR